MKMKKFLFLAAVAALSVTVSAQQVANVKDCPDSKLHLYDGNGQDLGVLLDGQLHTYLPELDAMVQFSVYSTGDRAPARVGVIIEPADILLFELPDCQGRAYVPPAGTPAVRMLKILSYTVGGEGKYFRIDVWSGELRGIASDLLMDGTCLNRPRPIWAYSAEEVELPFSDPPEWPLLVR